ncbi:apolipoprotein L1-like isoform X3 [Aquarana catesbeiana]|uniref:apolipoprotein L1-like isoform X3 n=1 Tax=Aquarana catesbeiana TaxID=8400 RepID=UPI003CCA3FAA
MYFKENDFTELDFGMIYCILQFTYNKTTVHIEDNVAFFTEQLVFLFHWSTEDKEKLLDTADGLQADMGQLPMTADDLQADMGQLLITADDLPAGDLKADMGQLLITADDLQADMGQLLITADDLQADMGQLPITADDLQADMGQLLITEDKEQLLDTADDLQADMGQLLITADDLQADMGQLLIATDDVQEDMEQLMDTGEDMQTGGLQEDIEQLLKMLKKYHEEYEKESSLLEEATSDCVIELYSIADDVDKFHRNAVIANVVGSAVGIAGGITTLIGVALAPFTLGASLFASTLGIVAATAGGVTGVSASVADSFNTKKKCETVIEKVNEIDNMINTVHKIATNISDTIEVIKTVPLAEQATDIARMGGRGMFAVVEAGRLVHLGKISAAAAHGAKLATQGARTIRAISGVFAALFVFIDAAYVIQGTAELQEGAKTETAEQIREVAFSLLGTRHDMRENNKNLLAEIMGLISEVSDE